MAKSIFARTVAKTGKNWQYSYNVLLYSCFCDIQYT